MPRNPYSEAINMFNLPTVGVGDSIIPRREDPQSMSRRRFLEGNTAPQPQDQFLLERAQDTPDPFGVLAEVEALKKEREEQSLISDIAALDPSAKDYQKNLYGMFQRNPNLAGSKNALGLIDLQRQLAPKAKDYTSQFRDPVYRSTYEQRVKGGADPDSAYQQTLSDAANEEMAINLISAGVPADRHGELMTGNAFDRRKVAQAIADSKRKTGYDLPLSGDAKTEFETIVQDLARAQGSGFSPSDEEKLKYMAPGKETYSSEDWSKGYRDARAASIKDAQDRMGLFQQTYGDYYKLPAGLAPQTRSASPLPASQSPATPQSSVQSATVPSAGLLEKGNIDLTTRPIVKNSDGTSSTVRSLSFESDGKEILVPTVSEDGRIMSDDEAIKQYEKTGKHLGVFKTPEAATAYAKNLHDDYEQGRIKGYPAESKSPTIISPADLKRVDEVVPTTPQKSQYQGFKGLSRDEKLEPTGPEKFIRELAPFFNAVGNVVSNPADKLSDVFWAPKGTKMSALFEPPPNEAASQSRWTDSKKSVENFLVDLEGDKEGALELARAIVAGARLPADEFFDAGAFPKNSSIPGETRIDATLAALNGLKNKHKMPSGPAFRDMNGPVTWDKVIRSAAQDLLEQNGELTVNREGQAPTSATKKPNIIAIREKK